MKQPKKPVWVRRSASAQTVWPVVALVVLVGLLVVWRLLAASTPVGFEPEYGSFTGCANKVAVSGASNGLGVQFGSDSCPPKGSDAYGAQLPISYTLSSLTGTVRYVSPTGSDSASGTAAAPLITVNKAISLSAAGDTIVLRGGTYRQANINVTKSLKIIAYPGETPVFNGAQTAASGWTSEGSLQWHAYTAMPVTDGSGISFTSGQNLVDAIGKNPDQAWLGSGTQLKQVAAKGSVTAGKFAVESGRIYLAASDVAQGGIEFSQDRVAFTISAANSTLEGFRVIRYSNTASDYGVVKFTGASHNGTLRNIDISDAAFISVLWGSGSIVSGGLAENVTVEWSNWMGISANYTDNLILKNVSLVHMNQFGEFAHSPQSGGFKTSRTRGTKVLNSYVGNNNSHGLWFDQSNVDVDVANSQIIDNAGSGVFFEISDDLLLINNYIHATGAALPVKTAGSSGVKIINNTIVGGTSPVGVYTDNRSIPGCADPSQALCANSYSSDRDTLRAHPATLDWIPRIDIMQNNIIAYPNGSGYCGVTLVCMTQTNGSVTVAINTTIHKADSLRPQTIINGNVYANGAGALISRSGAGYSTLAAFIAYASGAPIGIAGFESAGKAGNSWVNADGSPTAALSAVHGEALAIPANANINQYIPAGTKHYGVLSK